MKKKGSALILSILMLSFFMTITLTMYYIARNRNKRSIYKIKGMKISNGLDSGSAIAHYELYLADEYVSRGHLYATSGSTINYDGDNEYYIETTTTTKAIQYTTEVPSGSGVTTAPINGKHYTGVVLNNYNEYFGATWDPTIIGTATTVDLGSTIIDLNKLNQPWIAEDKVIITNGVVSRAWMNNTGEKIVRLWTKNMGDAISVGGYRLINIEGTAKDGSPVVAPLDADTLNASTLIELTYEKIVSIDKTTIGSTGTEDYRITYIEEVEVTPTGSSIVINNDELKSMVVEKLK